MELEITSDNLPTEFDNIIVEKNEEYTLIRSSLLTKGDIEKWVRSFSKRSNTRWLVRSSRPEGKRKLCSKKFICHLSSFNKVDALENRKGRSRNKRCSAFINISIKLTTTNVQKNDHYVKDGFCGVIKITNKHTHQLFSNESLRFLKPASSVKKQFLRYFDSGMLLSDACCFHEGIMELQGASEEDIANAVLNPPYRVAQNWYNSWTVSRGICKTPELSKEFLKTLRTLIKAGHTLKFTLFPFGLAVLSIMMKRSHALPSSKGVMYIEMYNSDASGYTVMFLTTSCSSGSVPIGILVIKERTVESFTNVFTLYNTAEEYLFSGQSYPDFIITDNCVEQIQALNNVWPRSTCYLSTYSVLRNVWRWLWRSSLSQDKRKKLMSKFEDVLYSKCTITAEEEMNHLIEMSKDIPKWLNYTDTLWMQKEFWCYAWRNESIVRSKEADAYIEIASRSYKDHILTKVKPCNIIGLMKLCCIYLEDFYKLKYINFARSEDRTACCLVDKITGKRTYLNSQMIQKISENEYGVRSESSATFWYTVNTLANCCLCSVSCRGGYCKHLSGIHRVCGTMLFDMPVVSKEGVSVVVWLALGDKTPNDMAILPSIAKKLFIEEEEEEEEEVGEYDNEEIEISKGSCNLTNYEEEIVTDVNYEEEIVTDANYEEEIVTDANYEEEIVTDANYEEEIVMDANCEEEIVTDANYEKEIVMDANYEEEIVTDANYENEFSDLTELTQ